MGESLHCDVCGKPATVHLTQILKNQIQKVDLCDVCAQSKGVTDPEGSSLAELLAKSFVESENSGGTEESGALVCEQCGYTGRDFKKHGRLGCPACYQALQVEVSPLLSGLHKGSRHLGKTPKRSVRQVALKVAIETVERQLLEAIKQEKFEEAAQRRDELDKLRARPGAPAPKN